MQRTDPDDEQDQADTVDRVLEQRQFVALEHPPGDEGAGEGNWQVDVENPRPAVLIAQIAAEDRAEHWGDQRGHRP